MRKQKVILNKFERMLLESKFPTLKILLEKDEALDDLFGDGDSGGEKEKEDKGEDKAAGGDEGLDDLFGGGEEGGEGGEEEGTQGGEGGEEEGTEGGEDTAASEDGAVASEKDSKADADDKKKKEQEAIEKAAKTSAAIYKNVAGDAIETGDDFNKALFGSRSSEMRESYQLRTQRNRIQENISKYLFQNVNMRQVARKKNLSLGNFYMNEKKLMQVNHVINEANSVDEIINNKFWEDNATVDLIVDNAINLTRHFEELIDIPKLIMNSVAIKFGKQAAQESGENKNAENEYKLKLDEFLQKYSTALKELPDYENYDTSRTVYDANNPDHAAVGAFSPGG